MTTSEFLLFEGKDWTLSAKIDGKTILRDVTAGTNEVSALIVELSQSIRPIMTFDEHPKNVTNLQIDFKLRKICVVAETDPTETCNPHSKTS